VSKTINISDISLELADEMGISKAASKTYTDIIFEKILKHLEDGDSVNVKMFGKFEMNMSAPRVGRNINSGEMVKIPSKHKIKFTMSRALSRKYNEIGTDEE